MFDSIFFEFSNFLIFILVIYMIMIFFLFYFKVLKRRVNFEKIKYTMEFCLKDDRNYNELILNNIRHRHEYSHQIEKGSMEMVFSTNHEILDYFEKISIAINAGVFDESIIKRYYQNYFFIIYEELKYPIMEKRIYANNPSMYIEYEKIVHMWKNSNDVKYSKEMSV